MAECVPNRKRIQELTEKEEKVLEERTPQSYELYQRAVKAMPMGVASTYQARDPYPLYFTHGKGSRIFSVDGLELSDFHNGFGCMVQGHAHPVIVETIKKRCELGTQFALPTEDSIAVAEILAKNFKLPQWRFVNSGSEATMDAIRVARAYTGRDKIMKIFGSYHGHHDYVMVSIGAVDYGQIGPRDNYASLPYGGGIPQSVADMTIPVPFNDAPMMEARLERMAAENDLPACLIMEPAMMNLGVVLPEDGYLQAVRDITRKYGIVLIFDEVKTGICTAAGGAVERWGVVPDMVTLAKALGAGLPSGAIGGTDEIMEVVSSGKVFQVGTYAGNPLSMATARASLERVMTPDAYKHLNYLNDRLIKECDAVCAKYDFPGYTVGISSKGCVNFAIGKITDYESFIKNQDHELVALAWLYNINRGVIIAPGREEEWTLSIQHNDEDIDRYVNAFEELVRDVTA
ncbi:MAG TPA: aspartate aminotransferase family protein [Thermoleophilia bacterium]|nr:aspartate aminotransferase family protein [Thermoleophilia bacterium]HQG03906.1 aspartate aminotransferase family protein [Thermoleophilia bacterium]HQJ98336.1 aspartate aminotransferase family protein [Thermoleophilia bacterium]